VLPTSKARADDSQFNFGRSGSNGHIGSLRTNPRAMADMMSDRLVKNQGMHINQLIQMKDQGLETDLSSRNQVGLVQALSPLQLNAFTLISQ
jgi:hypothetical protein